MILGAFVVSAGGAAMMGKCVFYCCDNCIRYAPVLGGKSFAGIFLANMEKGGMKKRTYKRAYI